MAVPDLPLGDILYGHGEWREVQPIVRSTVKTLYETVQLQAASIRQMQRTLGTKVEHSDFGQLEQQVGSRISYQELNEFADDLSNRMVELNVALSRKADNSEIANELQDIRQKVSAGGTATTSPFIQKWVTLQGEKQKSMMAESQRQLQHHSGMVSDALEVAARYREVDLEAQRMWVEDQLRKLKKTTMEGAARETAEREQACLGLWKEVRALAESLQMDQAEHRMEAKEAQADREQLAARISQVDVELSNKISTESEAAAASSDAVISRLNAAEDKLTKELAQETSERKNSHDALRQAVAKQVDAEAEARARSVEELAQQLTANISSVDSRVTHTNASLEAEVAEWTRNLAVMKDELGTKVANESEARKVQSERLSLEVKDLERHLTAAINAEGTERQRSDDALHADIQQQAELATEARNKLGDDLRTELSHVDTRVMAAVTQEADERKIAIHLEEGERKKADLQLRTEVADDSDAIRTDIKVVRTDMGNMEQHLRDNIGRESEERRKSDTSLHAEMAAELDSVRRENVQRIRECQASCNDAAKNFTDSESIKREQAFEALKQHVDFHVKGTADEVIQMWTYVQRIDTEVREVVLRLDKRMSKIYGRA
ncbi:hypothetical protein CYMTET_8240 [Cymbomonas tetramitiformis]|uniref:Uncharacterized protein n=1 Tax=Cymbomonas tetramitiformis TaxID=36881 RepID=A0AAE0GU26_9CHLO|nr:hypothetical protein CYMTET_8240 [Cymbomonas tetramitiformis]|eukprot:gene899-1412_t